MSEGTEGQQPQLFQGEQSKPHYTAAEVAHILKKRALERGDVPAPSPETRQNQSTEARLEHPSPWVDRVNQELQRQRERDEWWLKENAENPEMAKEWETLWKNAEMLRDNLGKFSEDNQDIPASDETKQKLQELGQRETADKEEIRWENMSTHERSIFLFLGSLGVGGMLEALDYLGVAPTRSAGLGAGVGLIMGTAIASSIEGYELAKKAQKN
jgi:hypothetical protein